MDPLGYSTYFDTPENEMVLHLLKYSITVQNGQVQEREPLNIYSNLINSTLLDTLNTDNTDINKLINTIIEQTEPNKTEIQPIAPEDSNEIEYEIPIEYIENTNTIISIEQESNEIQTVSQNNNQVTEIEIDNKKIPVTSSAIDRSEYIIKLGNRAIIVNKGYMLRRKDDKRRG
ncbi:hypothetical protein NEOKW01_1270 [Nematocida sp. AWRm80]|nr:hypothetical protein NEOKW01_1270 [Nematocida sp. AWRm80]